MICPNEAAALKSADGVVDGSLCYGADTDIADSVRALGVPEAFSIVKKTVESGKHDVTSRSGVATCGEMDYHVHALIEAMKGTV